VDEIWVHAERLDQFWHRWLNVNAPSGDPVQGACGLEFESVDEARIEDELTDDDRRCPACAGAQSLWGN
jgi:hypothetical protein